MLTSEDVLDLGSASQLSPSFASVGERLVDHVWRGGQHGSAGPAAIHGELTQFIEHAAVRGATPVLLSILTDEDQADVVRQRAFGRIAGQFADLRPDRV